MRDTVITIGPIVSIVTAAKALGLLCRPITWVGNKAGEALDPGGDLFFHFDAGDPDTVRVATLEVLDLCQDWQLTNKSILEYEYKRMTKEGF